MNKPIQEEFWFDMPEFVQEKQTPTLSSGYDLQTKKLSRSFPN
jgi:hypothetical protein